MSSRFLTRRFQGVRSPLEIRSHGRFGRGCIAVRTTVGGEVEPARIDIDIDKASFSEIAGFVNGIYPEIKKIIPNA